MFCGNCGKLVGEGNKFCTGCGQKITPIGSSSITEENINNLNTNPIDYKDEPKENVNYTNSNNNYNDEVICKTQDKVNVWLVILGIFLPVVGLILFLTLRKNTPKKANAIGIASLISFVLSFVVWTAIFVGIAVYLGNSYDSGYDYYYDDYYYDDYYEDYYDEYEKNIEDEINKLENQIEKFYEENEI